MVIENDENYTIYLPRTDFLSKLSFWSHFRRLKSFHGIKIIQQRHILFQSLIALKSGFQNFFSVDRKQMWNTIFCWKRNWFNTWKNYCPVGDGCSYRKTHEELYLELNKKPVKKYNSFNYDLGYFCFDQIDLIIET